MEFKNVSRMAREARAQISLPPGGVVSRLTLWVNGEEREAAFAGTAKVRKAYEEVAVVQRRDPVLVTSAGKDRVLMQCFPVPRNGGTMKVRIGVTAPWILKSERDAVLRLPRFLERNFNLPAAVTHSVWLETGSAGRVAAEALKEDLSKPGVQALRGELSDVDLSRPGSLIRAERDPEYGMAWTQKKIPDGQLAVQQMARRVNEEPFKRVLLVIDGAAGMKPYWDDIARALEQLPASLELGIWVARDGAREIAPVQKWTGATAQELVEKVRRQPSAGGQDNQQALLKAWDLAAESPRGAVIWIHGPQPVAFDQIEKLSQRLLWRPNNHPTILDLQTYPGPNRLAETPELQKFFLPIARLGTLDQDLQRLLAELGGTADRWLMVRDLVQLDSIPQSARRQESSSHLARLWAFDEIHRLLAAKKSEEAVRLAAEHQLVTPVSGAVVLETAEQFKRAGLEPVAAETTPTIPEPGTVILLVVGLAMLALWRRRARCPS
jgi:hypothetical protein